MESLWGVFLNSSVTLDGWAGQHGRFTQFWSEGDEQAKECRHGPSIEWPCCAFFFFFCTRPCCRLLTQTTFCRLLPGSTHQGCLFQHLVTQLLLGGNATEPFSAAVLKKKQKKNAQCPDKPKWVVEQFFFFWWEHLQIDKDKIQILIRFSRPRGISSWIPSKFLPNGPLPCQNVKTCHFTQTTLPGNEWRRRRDDCCT